MAPVPPFPLATVRNVLYSETATVHDRKNEIMRK